MPQEKDKSGVIDETTPLLALAGPMFIEMLLNIFINNIDTMMLGRYSENAVGAVGNANQIMNLVILMFNIIATATSVVVSQYLGAKQTGKMNQIYSLVVIVNLIFGLTLSGLLVVTRKGCMSLLKVSPEMMKDALTYIQLVGGFLFLQAVYNVVIQILRCNGYTKIGMYISLAANGINVIGNYIFLYGPLKHLELGVTGVAIATVFARTMALFIAFAVFFKCAIGKISVKYLIPFPKEMLIQMIQIGLPSAGESMSYNMYQLVLLSFVNSMGNDSVNARVFSNTLISFSMVFSNAAAMATQIITGHLVGAGKEDAAYKKVLRTLRISMPITILLSTMNWLLSPITLHIFTDNQAIIHLAFQIMLVDIVLEIGRCLNMTFVCSLKASGDYIFPLLVGLGTMWLIGVTVGYTCGIVLGFGVMGVYMGTTADECIRGVIVMARWIKGKWRGKSVVKK